MPPVKKPPHRRARTYLREWRKYRDMTQEQVAPRVAIDATQLGRIERGHSPYNQDLIERLAVVYACEPSDLLDLDPRNMDPEDDLLERLDGANPDVKKRVRAVIETMLKTD